jgi:hypothetical protein
MSCVERVETAWYDHDLFHTIIYRLVGKHYFGDGAGCEIFYCGTHPSKITCDVG